MAVPSEVTKELIVTVENENLTIAISPPVIDMAVVVGAPARQDGRTMLFDEYDPVNNTLRVLTAEGLAFLVGDATASGTAIPKQVIIGNGSPIDNSVVGTTDTLYFDRDTQIMWLWED